MPKKMIEYGWDVPTRSTSAHLREMEHRPFQGLIFKLRGSGNVLVPKAETEARTRRTTTTSPRLAGAA